MQTPSPTTTHIQIKEPPPSPGSPTNTEANMYAAGGGTQIYLQVSFQLTKDKSGKINDENKKNKKNVRFFFTKQCNKKIINAKQKKKLNNL